MFLLEITESKRGLLPLIVTNMGNSSVLRRHHVVSSPYQLSLLWAICSSPQAVLLQLAADLHRDINAIRYTPWLNQAKRDSLPECLSPLPHNLRIVGVR